MDLFLACLLPRYSVEMDFALTVVWRTGSGRPGCSLGASRTATAGNLIKCRDPSSLSIELSAGPNEK